MRRLILLSCLMLLLLIPEADARTLVFNGMQFDSEAQYIDMGNATIRDLPSFYVFLQQFQQLKKVDMFATPVRRTQIETMTKTFPDIEFGWTMQFAEHTLRTDATVFSTLHYSKDQKHGNADIALVRFCRHLKALDFGHNSVSDLSFLYELPELRVLIIACNQVEDITPISSLKNLEYLELFTNNIRDISALEGLDHLVDLNISYNYISDITPIFSLKNLKRLWSCRSVNRGMNVSLSNEQIQAIKAAIPGIREINNLSNPTGGTWREHPHFEVIHRMFRAGVYEPFADSFLVEDETRSVPYITVNTDNNATVFDASTDTNRENEQVTASEEATMEYHIIPDESVKEPGLYAPPTPTKHKSY